MWILAAADLHRQISGARLPTRPNIYRPQRSWGKVIFSVACVKNSVPGVHPPGRYPPPRGRYTPWAGTPRQVHSPGKVHPRAGTLPPWSMSGRYVSYWSAFLFLFFVGYGNIWLNNGLAPPGISWIHYCFVPWLEP